MSTPALRLFSDGHWHHVSWQDQRARRLADRHYSRQQVGTTQFLPPGKRFVLLTDDGLAVRAVVENMDPAGGQAFRCTIFRNEGPVLSSVLVREATERTYDYWRRHYDALPAVPLRTEVDPKKTRAKRDPGRCFLKAGWKRVAVKRGLVHLEAPAP